MNKRVFVSYSSPDVDKADAIRAALEAAGVSCWIAPRDLEAGNQWGGSIVQAIQQCEAVVVVFSDAANRSPQVAREMELAVSNRKPLVPIRVANDMPTDDMQYFLGVSHWFNAFAKPLDTYLPDIVTSVKNILAKGTNPWANAMRRMPKSRNGQILLIVGAVLVVGLILLMSRPHLPSPAEIAKMSQSPLTGRWEAKIAGASGNKSDCIFDLPAATVMATFSDGCPPPLSGTIQVQAVKGSGVMAPDVYKSGDSGSYGIYGGDAGNVMGAFKFGLFGGLTTRDNRFGTVKWTKISSDKPVKSAAAALLPATTQWPLSGVSGLIGRANSLVRSKWQKDAVLMSIEVKPGSSSNLDGYLTYYSPSTQHSRNVSFDGSLGAEQLGAQNANERIPDQVLDLPAALNRAGLQTDDVEEADLEWTNGGCGTGNFQQDNGIMPRCPPGNFEGPQWRLMLKNNNPPRYVRATQ